MPHEDFTSRKKGIDDFTQQQLEELMHVDLAPDLSPMDFVEYLKENGSCRIIVDKNFCIYLGITTHYSMSTSLGNPGMLIDDGFLKRRKEFFRYNFIFGEWGIYFNANTYNSNLIKALGNKVMGYMKSIGIQV